MRGLHAFCFVVSALGCAEGRMPRAEDALPPDDAGDEAPGDAAPDAPMDLPADLLPFDGPRFDVPPRPDVLAELPPEADVELPPDAPIDLPAEPARRVDHCYLVDPRTLDVAPGTAAGPLRVAVFVAGVTAGTGRGADVVVELGVGPGLQDPLDPMGTWRWVTAVYDRDIDGLGSTGARDYDEHTGSLTAPAVPEEYAFVARARVGAGPWALCHFDLTPNAPYRVAWAGRMTVAPSSAVRVGYCNLQFPRALSLPAGGTASTNSYGRVFANGITNRGCSTVPAATELTAQWGYGPAGTYPSTAGWVWIDGRYNVHRDSNNPLIEGNCANIEYQATPRAPMDCAPRSFGWRFRVGTGPWTYCRWAPPAEGAPMSPPFHVWDPALAGSLTVTGCP